MFEFLSKAMGVTSATGTGNSSANVDIATTGTGNHRDRANDVTTGIGNSCEKANGVTSGTLNPDTGDVETKSISPATTLLCDLNFRYELRKYQQEILELVKIKIERGERQIHIVAPPGAGKTIIGLQMISELQENSLIISPTTTIQSQWGEKLNLFIPSGEESFLLPELIGTHEDKPLKPITLLTYQVLSTPGNEREYLEKLAHKSWVQELTSQGHLSYGDAELRIFEIMQNNKQAHDKEIARHFSRLRRKLSELLDLKEVLHPNALELIQALRRQKFKVVIFDECHHLTDYWAAIMSQIVKRLGDPVVIGLTGTPPEGKTEGQANRYLSLVGDIDYQVPTPALVREGGLAPFQDLVFFTTPTDKEESFLEEQHDDFHELIMDLTRDKTATFTQWAIHCINKACKKNWGEFVSQRPDLVVALCRFIWKQKSFDNTSGAFNLEFPPDVEVLDTFIQSPFIDDWMTLLEEFALSRLKTSAAKDDHKLYERICAAVAKLGYRLTEKGLRKQASPVDRVLAFSRSKAHAVAKILDAEYKGLSDRLRGVVVTDFEKMSATAYQSTKGVLTEESGGAIAVLRELLATEISNFINPCLVTGSLILVDNRIVDQFVCELKKCLTEDGYDINVTAQAAEGELFSYIIGESSQWESRLYVGMVTKLLERGITKTLIGTRGIFGEGWDCQSLNTLIDLTTTTTPMSVKQLRGRSIRIDTSDPLGARKVANNWDVVCIAPHLEKGLNDYQRFVRKHEGYFGICDDGQIESGVGHVHPAFSELTPAEVFANIEDLNIEMETRALIRDSIYDLWKVGQPYRNKEIGCIEVTKIRKLALTPPYIRRNVSYKDHVKLLRENLIGVWLEYGGLGIFCSGLLAVILLNFSLLLTPALVPVVIFMVLAQNKYSALYKKLQTEVCRPNTQDSSLQDMGIAVLCALQQCKFIPATITKDDIKVTCRSDGSYRVFLDSAEPQHSQYFIKSMQELLSCVSNQPFLIPKYEYTFPSIEERKQLKTFLLGKQKKKPNQKPENIFSDNKNFVADKTKENLATNNSDAINNNRFVTQERKVDENLFFKNYLKGRAIPTVAAYYPVPGLLARSQKGRDVFEANWNKYVSPGFIVSTQTKPELLNKYFGLGTSLAQRLLWE